MSNTGKTSTYIRKTNVKESTVLNTGFKKTRFLHQAIVGDTLIQLTSLTTPTGAVNYSAPNVSELSQTNLMQWTQNFTLTSSVRGLLIQNISYIINGASTIKLLFSALDAEIFEGVIDHNARTGLTMVDAAPLVVSGTLLANTTDFNVGTPYKVNMFPSFKRGAVSVEIDGQPAYRTDGNAAFGPGITGDYQEISSGAGLGQILRFNSDLVNDRFIMVTSVGALVEKPNGSTMAALETVQGQIDAIIPTLAELAGVAETVFQSAPNNSDLKSFGDRVLTAESNITSQGTRISSLETKETYACRVTASGSTTIAASGAYTKVLYNTIVRDFYNNFNTSTNTWTCPSTGWYRISASTRFDTLAWTQGNRHEMQAFKNGTGTGYMKSDIIPYTGSYYFSSLAGSIDLYLVSGDLIDIRVSQAEGTTRALITDPSINYLSIIKQGTQL